MVTPASLTYPVRPGVGPATTATVTAAAPASAQAAAAIPARACRVGRCTLAESNRIMDGP